MFEKIATGILDWFIDIYDATGLLNFVYASDINCEGLTQYLVWSLIVSIIASAVVLFFALCTGALTLTLFAFVAIVCFFAPPCITWTVCKFIK